MWYGSYIMVIPLIILAMFAQSNVKRTFNKYLKVRNMRNLTGAEVANRIIREQGLSTRVEMVSGKLSDHFDPRADVVRLSREVYEGNSVASISVAAHEVGHAVQHATGYNPLQVRTAIIPVANFGSRFAFLLAFGGFFLRTPLLIDIGIILYSAAVLFHVFTLPVEFNASNRAIHLMTDIGILYEDEKPMARKVLGAAAMTYVANTLIALMQLLRLILLRNSRR